MGFVLDVIRQSGGPIYTPSDLFCFVLPALNCKLEKFNRLCIWHLISRFKCTAVISSITCSNQTEHNFPQLSQTAQEILNDTYIYSYCFTFNPLNPELNPICYLLASLGAHHFLHVSRIRVKLLTLRRLMSYIYGPPILDVSRSHTTTQRSR